MALICAGFPPPASAGRSPKTSRRASCVISSYNPGFVNCLRAAIPALIASGFPARVPACYTAPSGATDDFPECRKIRFDSQEFLHGTIVQAKSCNHFVDNQERAVLLRDFMQSLQETRLRRNNSHVGGDGLDDDRSDFILMLEKYAFDRLEIVIGYVQCQSSQRSGNSRAFGNSKRGEPRTRL